MARTQVFTSYVHNCVKGGECAALMRTWQPIRDDVTEGRMLSGSLGSCASYLSWLSSVRLFGAAGGNCLIPVFALGRAQELLLILDEYSPRRSSAYTGP